MNKLEELAERCWGCGGELMKVGSQLLWMHRHYCPAFAASLRARSMKDE